MVTDEKNRPQNCLIVSNLKLDDVSSNVFGKSLEAADELFNFYACILLKITQSPPYEQTEIESFFCTDSNHV